MHHLQSFPLLCFMGRLSTPPNSIAQGDDAGSKPRAPPTPRGGIPAQQFAACSSTPTQAAAEILLPTSMKGMS